ncbi:MAG: hypothetical protein ABI647_07525 [Gemmatimonadota bacterium]
MSALTIQHRSAARLTVAVLLIAVTGLGACKKSPTEPRDNSGAEGGSGSIGRVDR